MFRWVKKLNISTWLTPMTSCKSSNQAVLHVVLLDCMSTKCLFSFCLTFLVLGKENWDI
jgi:hypothetical protein